MWTKWIDQVKEFFIRLGYRMKQGQGLIEYALIILLVVLVVIGALALFGDQLETAYQSITEAIPVGE